ncbi:hypothetical protein D3867_37060 (plasmid) [Azospirillum argentinense]|uniref:Uncharacterized protein n=1 Tax=Azospirillum brasilense TaxID=192 RepID=A0A4D8QAU8_AZOBR|nr:hypothetical protein D3867_37060 [Azospirillum argentinense]
MGGAHDRLDLRQGCGQALDEHLHQTLKGAVLAAGAGALAARQGPLDLAGLALKDAALDALQAAQQPEPGFGRAPDRGQTRDDPGIAVEGQGLVILLRMLAEPDGDAADGGGGQAVVAQPVSARMRSGAAPRDWVAVACQCASSITAPITGGRTSKSNRASVANASSRRWRTSVRSTGWPITCSRRLSAPAAMAAST